MPRDCTGVPLGSVSCTVPELSGIPYNNTNYMNYQARMQKVPSFKKGQLLSNFAPSGKGYSPKAKNLSKPEVAFLKSYLNGHHDNNYVRSPGCPASSGTDTVVRHSTASGTIAASTDTLSFIVTGIPECPIIFNNGSQIAGIPYTNMPFIAEPYPPTVFDFLKDSGVGRYRCCGMSVKIEDETAAMYKQGNIMAVRNPAAVDLVPLTTSAANAFGGLPIGAGIYVRAVETLPLNENAITSLSSNFYQGKMEDGLYAPLPFLDPLNPFINRDVVENKAMYSVGVSTTDINSFAFAINPLAVKTSASGNLIFVRSDTGAGTFNITTPNLIPCSPTNMQSLMILCNGLLAGTSKIRISVNATWEFVTAYGGKFADLVKPPMETNFRLLTIASEVFRTMPAAYPASANGLDEIWSKFKEVYNDYVEPIARNVISNLPPQYAPIAGTVKGLLDTVTDAKKEIKKEVNEMKQLTLPGSRGRR